MLESLMGRPQPLPDAIVERYPELRDARFRRGGLLPRIAGWCLGQSTVAAITLWNTVFLSRDVRLDAELLLHELRHVHQFGASPSFPARYVWESLRRGYHANRFEADARAWAAARLARERSESRGGDV